MKWQKLKKISTIYVHCEIGEKFDREKNYCKQRWKKMTMRKIFAIYDKGLLSIVKQKRGHCDQAWRALEKMAFSHSTNKSTVFLSNSNA